MTLAELQTALEARQVIFWTVRVTADGCWKVTLGGAWGEPRSGEGGSLDEAMGAALGHPNWPPQVTR